MPCRTQHRAETRAAWSDATPPKLVGSGTALNAISVVARDDVWAVGVNGHIAHFDGTGWKVQQLEPARVSKVTPTKNYYDLLGVAAWPSEVWVSDSQSGYYRYDLSTWSTVTGCPHRIQQLWGTSPRDVWLPGGRVAHFDGTRWDTSTVLEASMRSVHGSAPDDVWMVGWQGSHKDNKGASSHFNGKSWKSAPMPSGTALLRAVHAARRDEAYAVGNDGWAVAWNGKAWRPSATGVAGLLKAVYSPGKGVAFAGGEIGPWILRKR